MKNPFKHRKDYRLSYRLLLYIMICSSFFTIIGTSVQLYFDYNRDIKKINAGIRHIEKGYLQSIASNLWAMDSLQIKKNLEGAFQLQDIQYLEVRELRESPNAILETIGNKKDSNIISKTFYLEFGKAKRRIGTLLVVASKDAVWARLKEKVLLILATQALKTFFVSIFILFIFYFLIMKHLNSLTKYFKEFDLNKLEKPLSINRKSEPSHPDEFGRLVSSVNLMRLELKQSIKEGEKSRKDIQESKEKYAQLFNSGNDAVLVHKMDKDGSAKFIEFNDLACVRLGYTREELLVMSPMDIDGGGMNRERYRAIEELKKNGQCLFEMVHISKSGNKIPVEISSSVFKKKGERYVLSIARDITDRKEAVASLKKSEKFLRTVYEAAENVAFVVTDLAGDNTRILDVSPGTEKIFGYSRNEMIGERVAIFYPPEFVKDFPKILAELSENKEKYSGEVVMVRKSGEHFPTLFTVYPKFDDSGSVVGTIGVAIDITDRKLEEERYKTTIESSIDGFWITDTKGDFLEVNEAYCNMIGYRRDELLNMSIMDVEVIEQPEETKKRIEKIIKDGSDRFETKHQHKKGKIIEVEVSITYTQDSNGMFFVFLRDITERKQLESQLQQSQKMESIGTLAGGIAHDFNNILFPIVGHTEMLIEDIP
ncbi:MAG: PAS domain S-box protein, partial [Bacteroidales bacterium]|nr:PAS domain S-box protein [Bacteroidales bacterium]